MMKFHKYFLVLPLLLGFTNFYGMKRDREEILSAQVGFINAAVKVAFVPQNDIKKELFSLLDSAKGSVLVAMYWMTDGSIVEKLISLKQKGIDVRILVDETSPNLESLINKLSRVNIHFLVFPSMTAGPIMHHKFLVVDGLMVFTGSANFTKKAFDLESQFLNNYENVLIFNSSEISQKYMFSFQGMEKKTLDAYIDMVAKSESGNFPRWTQLLFPKYDDNLKQVAQGRLQEFKSIEQNRLQKFFNLKPIPPTQQQGSVEKDGPARRSLPSQ